MASGLSMPVGFKNGTDGSLQTALDAMQAARAPHSFLGIDQDGATAIVRTKGNRFGHVVLRGGRSRTNYDPQSIAEAVAALREQGQDPALMVDCSHANSNKRHAQQEHVAHSVIKQRATGNHRADRPDDRELPERGQAARAVEQGGPAVRREHHRRVRELGNDRTHPALRVRAHLT